MTLYDTGLLSPVRAGTPVEEATSDTAWAQAMLDAEAALARAQARLGTVPEAAAAVITGAADVALLDVRALALAARETANPVVGLVAAFTAVVAERDAAAAEYVHRGSTSQDVFDTGALLVTARALRLVRDDLRRTADALGRLAAAHRDTPAAARTLALQAVPTTFGLRAAGWRQLVLDAGERVARLLDGGLPVALGGAAGTLAGYMEYARLAGERDLGAYAGRLAALFAEETGLARPPAVPWHALRTPMADAAAALSLAAGALGKFALDVQNLTRTEVGEVAEPAVAGRGASSAMPHKRNPVLATMIRTAALQVPAFALVLTQQLPAEDERSAGAWHAEWLPLRECLRLVGGAARTAVELAEGLEVRAERMRANLALTGGQMVSERVAAVLARRVGRGAARRLLTELSGEAARVGCSLAEVLSADARTAAFLSAEEYAELCDPERYVGGAGVMVDAALTRGS
ncbi:lyase family protein [Streptomyces caatingaensis]|uniref:3-carboxy-cis,cis-muconate cycloisomerase n=1 Tax=Streptomyces caatingaensis TaxID=1678637 RepID=A0A0K9XAA6_9ACTN|nr:lyase family protein [Streptomyces caatingaensis]KNB50031.1 3-carboxy-cis,cis-muconate cycloisomerase [Streptomyces caatingaensis]